MLANRKNHPVQPRFFEEEEQDFRSEGMESDVETGSEPSSTQEDGGSGILIAYFTMPEDVDTDGVDAVAGASIVVDNGEVMGNVNILPGSSRDGRRRFVPD